MKTELREELSARLLDLLAIESVTCNEGAIADSVERWALGLDWASRDDVTRSSHSVIVGSTSDTRPSIALVGHLDTVPVHPEDGPPRRDGDLIYGLGASDMKGSLAVMQLLAERLPVQELPFSLVLVFYDQEEGPYATNGLQPLLDKYEWLRDLDLAIAMEPTDNTLQLGCVGSIQARVRFSGKSAHSARPWQGENAIHKAGTMLSSLWDRAATPVEVEGLTFFNAMSVTLANGGRARNVVPDRFELNVNYRFAPTLPIADCIAEAVERIKATAIDAEIEILDIAPPGPVPVDNPLLDHLQSVAHLEIRPKQAWTDVARLAAFGIDAINYGPGFGAQAHQKGEHISLPMMAESYEVLERILNTPMEGL